MDLISQHADLGSAAGYRVLARKYRPWGFDQLIGQEAMVRTLTNSFTTGRIAQAWILTGVRGVGKTTTARILARALNYDRGDGGGPTVEMTEPGIHCASIMESRHVDVLEMDAASRTGIDDVREIVDGVRYAPASARYKVYIIDEVHMLSEKAFNAFLKTLEEPPPHVKFVFATTEIRKVPVTVLSRCQRFNLRRVDSQMLVSHLARIGVAEGIAAEPEALATIARAAEGSVRDALSLFDQAIAHGGSVVRADDVHAMLGLTDRGRIVTLFEQIMRGEAGPALQSLRAQYEEGADPATVIGELAEFVHLVTRIKVVPQAGADGSVTEVEREAGQRLAGLLSMSVLARAWQMLLKGISEVQQAQKPEQAADMLIVRLAHAADLPTPDEALKVLKASGALESGGGVRAPSPSGGGPVARVAAGGQTQAVALAAVPTMQSSMAQPAVARRVESAPLMRIESFEALLTVAESRRDLPLKFALERHMRVLRCEHGQLEFVATGDASPGLAADLHRRLLEWTGQRWVISLATGAGPQTVHEQNQAAKAELRRGVDGDPQVRAVLERFPGAVIVDVRPPVAEPLPEEAAESAADAIAEMADSDEPPEF